MIEDQKTRYLAVAFKHLANAQDIGHHVRYYIKKNRAYMLSDINTALDSIDKIWFYLVETKLLTYPRPSGIRVGKAVWFTKLPAALITEGINELRLAYTRFNKYPEYKNVQNKITSVIYKYQEIEIELKQ